MLSPNHLAVRSSKTEQHQQQEHHLSEGACLHPSTPATLKVIAIQLYTHTGPITSSFPRLPSHPPVSSFSVSKTQPLAFRSASARPPWRGSWTACCVGGPSPPPGTRPPPPCPTCACSSAPGDPPSALGRQNRRLSPPPPRLPELPAHATARGAAPSAPMGGSQGERQEAAPAASPAARWQTGLRQKFC